MEMVITAGLALLTQAAPLLSTSSAVGAAINWIATLLPPAVKLAQAEIPVVKSIIATLRGNGAVTADQMAQLDALDAQCDAALDVEIKSAEDEDAADAGT